MNKDQRERGTRTPSDQPQRGDDAETDKATDPRQAGDNRRAGDTDGNATGGNSKSKGAENPADDSAQP